MTVCKSFPFARFLPRQLILFFSVNSLSNSAWIPKRPLKIQWHRLSSCFRTDSTRVNEGSGNYNTLVRSQDLRSINEPGNSLLICEQGSDILFLTGDFARFRSWHISQYNSLMNNNPLPKKHEMIFYTLIQNSRCDHWSYLKGSSTKEIVMGSNLRLALVYYFLYPRQLVKRDRRSLSPLWSISFCSVVPLGVLSLALL